MKRMIQTIHVMKTMQHTIKGKYLASLLHQLGALQNNMGYHALLTLLVKQVGNHSNFKKPEFWKDFYNQAGRLNYALKKFIIRYRISRSTEVKVSGKVGTEIIYETFIEGEKAFLTSPEVEEFNERLVKVKMKLSYRSAGISFEKKGRKFAEDVVRKNRFSLSVEFYQAVMI